MSEKDQNLSQKKEWAIFTAPSFRSKLYFNLLVISFILFSLLSLISFFILLFNPQWLDLFFHMIMLYLLIDVVVAILLVIRLQKGKAQKIENLKIRILGTIIVVLPVTIILLFYLFPLHYVWNEIDFFMLASLTRSYYLAILIPVTFIFSRESLVWKSISASFYAIYLLYDATSVFIGNYAIPTTFTSIQYDFFAHLLAGLTVVILSTHILTKEEYKVNSVIIFVLCSFFFFLWEYVEFLGLHLTDHGKTTQFENLIMDILGNYIGLAIGLSFYILYGIYNRKSKLTD